MRDGWKSLPLAKLCTVFTDGDWIETKNQSSEGIRLIQTGNVGVGEYKDRRNKARFISEETFKKLKCEEIYEGDCLVSRLPDPVGRSCIIPDTGDRMITAVDCTILRFDASYILLKYFNYYSQSALYLRDVDDHCTGATRNRISRKNLGKVSIPVPPLPEQKRIVAILDEAFTGIETAIANTEKNLANARELFESYLNSVFSQRGEGWQEKDFGEIAEFKNGLNFTRNSIGERVRIVGVKDFKSNYWVPVDELATAQVDGQLNENYELREKDILIVRSNGNKQLIGRCLLIDTIQEKTSYSGFTIRARMTTNEVMPEFLAHFLKADQVREELIKSGGGTNISSLNQKALASLPVWFPTREQQADIVKEIIEINSETQHLESIYQQKLTALTELKQSLLQKAFSGELTANKEVINKTLKEEQVA